MKDLFVLLSVVRCYVGALKEEGFEGLWKNFRGDLGTWTGHQLNYLLFVIFRLCLYKIYFAWSYPWHMLSAWWGLKRSTLEHAARLCINIIIGFVSCLGDIWLTTPLHGHQGRLVTTDLPQLLM